MNDKRKGWWLGLAGMLIFSGSLPATRVAVQGFSPLCLTAVRASTAAALGALALLAWDRSRPQGREWLHLLAVSGGVVLGFPLLSAMALRYITAADALVLVALLPLCTASFAVLRAGERPRTAFWVYSAAGAALVAVFALAQGARAAWLGDALMLLAVLVCGYGYAEGARLSRKLGGWQVICWALLVALPLTLPLAGVELARQALPRAPGPWIGLAYVSVFSMLIGFVFWYRGLALGGIASVGQLQLLQPFVGLLLAAALLGETVAPGMLATALAVVACVAAARRHG
ncbi:MAG: DMT family transporter [Betaproteobacteria bacterium]|nr:DMT family transporter [Betaproteobacteria bacterium]MBU6512522.1 DMT family transporter [Betaproteobacteria bacterium]MDE1954181.1 DMT family transporter [Betaproteobacteria bacterium]MDE2153859.1 DMT family transporter [Betaproteobacteria bacterium]MDE2478890.1 DMT family transporter [Betaproteobacteria bacterium]